LVRGDEVLGAGRLRHRLNAALEAWGGHIGYDIKPSQRRIGYGTLLLSLLLHEATTMGLPRVLLMCYANNTSSIGVMRRNGARLQAEEFSERANGTIRRYRIDLTPVT
jgi:predicted acetyltransferase